MDALLRRREMMAGGEPPIPYTSIVEYLENTGGSYIDTGYYPTSSTRIEMSVMVLASNASSLTRFFETRVAIDDRMYGILNFGDSNNMMQYRYGNARPSGSGKLIAGTRYKINTIDSNLYVDEQLKVAAGARNFRCTRTLVLWGFVNGSSAISSSNDERFRLYYCKIYDGDTLVLDLIPCRVDNEGCLYDAKSRNIISNGGSNPFVFGQDIQ